MAWTPITGTMTQYSTSANALASNYYLKFYQSGTTTAFNMATDSTGGTTLDKCQLDSSGYPTTDGSTRFIPHVNQKYKIVLYKNSTDADANTTGNADWVIDAVEQPNTVSNSEIIFETVAAMVASTTLSIGDHVRTLGYTAIGDGGGNEYDIVAAATGTADGGSYIDLATHQAKGLFPGGVYNVKQFGAVGDGVTDDTSAIQSALNTGFKYIYTSSPSVKYLITDQSGGFGINITTAGQTLFGDGMDSSIFDYNSTTTARPAILVSASNVKILYLQVDGSTNATDAGSGTATNCHGIQVTNVNECRIQEVKIKGGHYGIHFENDTGSYANNLNNEAIGCMLRNTASSGVHLTRAEYALIQRCDAKDCGTDGFKTSVYSRYCRVIGNVARDCTRDGFDFYDGFIESLAANNLAEGNTLQGFEIKGTFDASNYVVRESTFIGNVAIGNGTQGFLIQSVRNCTFAGNKAISNTESGFFLNVVQGCNFAGDSATKNTKHGFFFNGSESRNTFTGCHAYDNSWVDGTTQNGTYDGFYLTSGAAGVFSGCIAINGTTAGEKGGQGYGITFNSSGSALTGCFFNGNVTGDIQNQTNATILNVRDNAGNYMNSFGSWSSSADAAVNGYIDFVDDTGTARKLATIA